MIKKLFQKYSFETALVSMWVKKICGWKYWGW